MSRAFKDKRAQVFNKTHLMSSRRKSQTETLLKVALLVVYNLITSCNLKRYLVTTLSQISVVICKIPIVHFVVC